MFNRIYIEITNVCNLKCDFCPITKRDKKFMTESEFNIIVSKIKGYTKHVYLHIKGEPFMHPDIFKFIKILNDNDIFVNITTNARLIDKYIDDINKVNIRQLNISLHSFNNIDDISNLLNTIDKIKDTYISLRLWNNKDNKEVLNLLERHYNKNIDFKGNRFTLTKNIYLDKDRLFDWPDINKDVISEYGTCKAKGQLGILVDGTVVPCCLDNDGVINLGNIFNENMDDILNNNRYKNMIDGFKCNKLNEELCKKCGYRNRFN